MLLSRTLGLTLAELGSMSQAELALWHAEYSREPWGEDRDDLRAARICQAIFGSKGIETKLDDFLPRWRADEPEAQSEDEQQRILRNWTAACGGNVR